jgi:hypothetical protein
MEDLKEAQLHVMLRGMLARLQTMEGAIQVALHKGGAAEEGLWDLFALVVQHDHCELCGVAIWGTDHTCQET